MNFMGLHDFSSEKKRFPSGKEAISHSNQLVDSATLVQNAVFSFVLQQIHW